MEFRGSLLQHCSEAEAKTAAWLPFESRGKIKRYVRRDAGQTGLLASEVRVPSVLLEGTRELVIRCLPYLHGESNVAMRDEAINWFLDRSRAVRQDFIAQSAWLESDAKQSAHYLQSMLYMTRFLISQCCCGQFSSKVDDKFFNDALLACISTALGLDPDNAECQAYAELVLGRRFYFQRPHPLLQYCKERNWIMFKVEFKNSEYLVQCAASKHVVGDLQFSGLQVLNSSFAGRFPLQAVVKWLGFSSPDEARKFLEECGVTVIEENVEFKKSIQLHSPMQRRNQAFYGFKRIDCKELQELILKD